MEDITEGDYADAKSNRLSADIFESFRNTCLKICKLDPAKFLSIPGLAWQAALKKDRSY